MVGSEPVDFHLTDRRGAYDFVTRTLRRLNYAGLSKANKGVVRCFVAKVTGLSRAQSTRLIGQYRNTGHIRDRRCGATRPFERRYTAADIRLLAEVDETLGGLCGPTTRRVMRRQYEVFGDERFERLAGLSNSHLYRIRQSTTYRRRRNPTTKTQATQVSIGERRKPHGNSPPCTYGPNGIGRGLEVVGTALACKRDLVGVREGSAAAGRFGAGARYWADG